MTASHPHISILLLAAGGSSRMGQPKQLLKFGTSTLLRHLAQIALASSAGDVRVVLGSSNPEILRQLDGLDLTVVNNPQWHEGISTSIREGVSSVPSSQNALLIMLCDQPKVTTDILDSLIERYTAKGASIVACEYGGTIGVPALFDRSMFGELGNLRGDTGAKPLLSKHSSRLEQVPFPDGAIDVDTLDDARTLGR